jgi:hypothetical protein
MLLLTLSFISFICLLSPLYGMEKKIPTSVKGSITFKVTDTVRSNPAKTKFHKVIFGEKDIQGLNQLPESYRGSHKRKSDIQLLSIAEKKQKYNELREQDHRFWCDGCFMCTKQKALQKKLQEKESKIREEEENNDHDKHSCSCFYCTKVDVRAQEKKIRSEEKKQLVLYRKAALTQAHKNHAREILDTTLREQIEGRESLYVSSDRSSPLISDDSLESMESLSSNNDI